MPTKRELRDMLHAEQERSARVLKRRNEVGDAYLVACYHRDVFLAERDSARTVAVRLEQENALLTAALKAYAEAFGAIGTEFRAAAIATHRALLAGGQA